MALSNQSNKPVQSVTIKQLFQDAEKFELKQIAIHGTVEKMKWTNYTCFTMSITDLTGSVTITSHPDFEVYPVAVCNVLDTIQYVLFSLYGLLMNDVLPIYMLRAKSFVYVVGTLYANEKFNEFLIGDEPQYYVRLTHPAKCQESKNQQ